ncbi:RagB/SusD family nutrient uptake outer membrane protein [Parachryseolinea silvisoli]|uniref:RagB/SusD family nutrient uptake outer membrane protein n=1 Tax=Parachryseolinea silvisoli TaxID=2873601 RepID=UPI002265C752|nr:RagB/SusD family nutrient uptake outer membrane protein [Parachryseolinea silvisoli]MCD9014444.1 RagB/SusD family nutrient uptake outer membrane protein [Parachryseolinea silvisoli]
MKINCKSIYIASICLYFGPIIMGCDELLDIDEPNSKVSIETVFRDDGTATSAVTGLYTEMLYALNFASGNYNSVTALAGLSSDELINYWPTNTTEQQFYDNNIVPQNDDILSVWTSAYKVIYQANSVFEGLTNSSGLTAAVREQLQGEALFVRAFTHFYLINLFGAVPLITSTDYRKNTSAPRSSVDQVYDQVIVDLLAAQTLMSGTYTTSGRVRPNSFTAMALLARVYLYRKDWANADVLASNVINEGTYQIESDLNNVFTSSSTEAIWQLQPLAGDINTWEGNIFILDSEPAFYYLNKDLVDFFEVGDKRLESWTGSFENGSDTFYYPFKYKVKYGGTASTPPMSVTEYSMVFRLAEQYLIRAEARAHLENYAGAISDLDAIRGRADLPLIADTNPTTGKSDLLLLIENERRSELFTEWGHRWFDLKRTDRSTEVLSASKADWQPTDVLYPLPDLEFTRNPNLKDQNEGY